MKKQIEFNIVTILLLAIILIFSFQSSSKAKAVESIFNKQMSYDIYFFSAEDAPSIIQDVEIHGIKDIAGKLFLVIRVHGFKLKDEEGYILFDSVTAILPNQRFRIKHREAFNISF